MNIELPSNDEDAYLRGRAEYNDRYANLAASKRNWQFATLGFFLVAILTSAVSIIQVRQVKLIPYLVQMDPAGELMTVMPRLDPSATTIPMNLIELATVREFIRDARTVVDDFPAQDTLLRRVMAHAAGPAARFLKDYYENGHNPHVTAHEHSTMVTISSTVPIGPHSWQIRFIEQYFDHNGMRVQGMPDAHWIALLHTQILGDPGQSFDDPAGIKIVALQWSPEQVAEGQ